MGFESRLHRGIQSEPSLCPNVYVTVGRDDGNLGVAKHKDFAICVGKLCHRIFILYYTNLPNLHKTAIWKAGYLCLHTITVS